MTMKRTMSPAHAGVCSSLALALTLSAAWLLPACDDDGGTAEGDAAVDAAASMDASGTQMNGDAAGPDAAPSDAAEADAAMLTDAAEADAAPTPTDGAPADDAAQTTPDAASPTPDAAPDTMATADAMGPCVPVELQVDGVYGPFKVAAIEIAPGAMPGVYTFSSAGSGSSSVTLVRANQNVATFNYAWQTTIYADTNMPPFAFTFDNVLTLKIRKAGSGTINMYDAGTELFSGCHKITVTGGV